MSTDRTEATRLGRGVMTAIALVLIVWGGVVFITSERLSGGQIIGAPLLLGIGGWLLMRIEGRS